MPVSTGRATVTFQVSGQLSGEARGQARGIADERAPLLCKRLLPRFAEDALAVEMLEREARVLGQLAGRAAPRLVASGKDAHGPYLLAEWLTMVPLSACRGELRLIERIAPLAFRALGQIHDALGPRGPLVHGDLSPDNVMASVAHGEAKIVDFGLARAGKDAGPPEGPFRGTLLYAAPELARGEAIDARADLFALAASLLHLAAVRSPRASAEPGAMLLEAAERPIDAWAAEAGARLGRDVREPLLRCVAMDREARPRRALDVFGEDPVVDPPHA